MTKWLLGGAAALAIVGAPASAASFLVGTGTDKPLIAANDFKSDLEAIGLDNLRNFASLAIDGPVNILVELLGSESGATDRVTFPFHQHDQVNDVDFFPAGTPLFTINFASAAAFSIQFSSSLSGFTAIHTPGTGEFGYFLKSSDNGSAVSTNVLYLGYDNQLTREDDDNHDDLVLRLTATAVPEPATWAMMVGGLGLLGMAMRRRNNMSVTLA